MEFIEHSSELATLNFGISHLLLGDLTKNLTMVKLIAYVELKSVQVVGLENSAHAVSKLDLESI